MRRRRRRPRRLASICAGIALSLSLRFVTLNKNVFIVRLKNWRVSMQREYARCDRMVHLLTYHTFYFLQMYFSGLIRTKQSMRSWRGMLGAGFGCSVLTVFFLVADWGSLNGTAGRMALNKKQLERELFL